jgi:hypothetical protein
VVNRVTFGTERTDVLPVLVILGEHTFEGLAQCGDPVELGVITEIFGGADMMAAAARLQ